MVIQSPKPSDDTQIENPKEVVRQGYNAISDLYDEAFGGEGKYKTWLAALLDHLPPSARVLDLGCGSGQPVAYTLAEAGHHVVGVDISDVQVEKARALVPSGEFIRGDAAAMEFEPTSFDAVVSFYAFIHMPLEEQPPLLKKIATWMKPGGVFAATVGHSAWTGSDPNWIGGKTLMWWSHADEDTYRSWLSEAGLEVREQKYVPEGSAGHTFFWAVKPTA